MASGSHNDGKDEKAIMMKQPDPIKSAINSVFNFDWEKFHTDFEKKYDAIREQVERQPSKQSEMRCEVRRLKSFQDSKDSFIEKFSWWNPTEMASAGFYHTGVSASVRCFCCGIVNNKKPLAYPPKKLHVEVSAACDFMKGEDVGNISMFEVRVQCPDFDQVSLGAYTTEETRNKSFTNWPSYATIQLEQLVKAGFFFTGRRDTVQCFSCGGCLGNWQESDDPWKEHAKWFPECDFLESMKTPEEIKEYINSYNAFEGFTGKDFIHNDSDQILPTQSCAANLNIFEDENVRLESFKKWPPDANVDAASLARCGFFYMGEQDAVRCYTCGIYIHSFQPGEDAMTEHLKHSPDCMFLKRMLEIKCENTGDTGSQQLQITDQLNQDVHMKELHNKESCLKIYTVHWSDKTRELRQCLTNVYNNSNFSKMSPFPEFSHISVDLSSLFADISIMLKDIRNCPLKQLSLPDILSQLGDITMIEGEAGSGKTALLKKIAILWASGRCPILNRFSLVFYISVSSTERQQSLCDIIYKQLMGSDASLTEEYLVEMIQQLKNKVLFLLDDYGLMDSASGAIEELVLNNPWNRVTLAVTVNTNTSRKVRQFAKNILSIQDFPFVSVLYIFKQLFSHDVTSLERFSMHLSQSTTLQSALKTPLFAFALCIFWVHNSAENISEDFYICMTYLMHKILKYGTEKDKIEALVLSCGQLALEGIFQSRFEFTQENLDKAGVKSDDALQFGLLSSFTSQRLKPIFKFFHPSFQKYLAGKKMSELLQSEDVEEHGIGLSYLQEINTFLSVKGRYNSFLKNSCMHSPKTATLIICHLFSLMNNPKAFAHEGETNLHLDFDPMSLISSMDSLLHHINPNCSNYFAVRMLLEFAINIANESMYLAQCAPIILQFLKDKDIIITEKADLWLLKFLHKYPEGLMLVKSLEIIVPHTVKNVIHEFWNSEEFKSIWSVPTIEEDYSNAFLLFSDILKNKLDFKYIKNVKLPDLSKLGFDADYHKISVLKIKAHSCIMEDENVLGNLMVFCNLAIRIELDFFKCTGFLNTMWPIVDLYKASIMKLSLTATQISREEQELFTNLMSLEILQINHIPPPEYILSNIHHFKQLKELEVELLDAWDVIGILPDEFKNLQRIEKLVFKNIDMETQGDKLAKMIEHFPNLISFTIESKYCPGFEKIINSLSQNTKMETLRINAPILKNEIIQLASVLPSFKSLKILEIADQYYVTEEASNIYAQALASLEKLEEFTVPGGPAVRKSMSCFIQSIQHMSNLRKLYVNSRQFLDSSLLELAKICADGCLRKLQVLDLNNNQDITQSGWSDFFNVLDNLPKLQHLFISRPCSGPFNTEPVTLIALIRCVCKLHCLSQLDMFGWLMDEKDVALVNEMKSKHPNGNSLTVSWQTILPFSPVIES